jgi:hypothetical protein
MFGPLLGGFMLARGWGAGPIFLMAAAPVLAVAAGTALVSFGQPRPSAMPRWRAL